MVSRKNRSMRAKRGSHNSRLQPSTYKTKLKLDKEVGGADLSDFGNCVFALLSLRNVQ